MATWVGQKNRFFLLHFLNVHQLKNIFLKKYIRIEGHVIKIFKSKKIVLTLKNMI